MAYVKKNKPRSAKQLANQFKKGQSGNPRGSSKMKRDLKGITVLDRKTNALIIQKLLNMKVIDLKKIVEDKETPVLELMIAKIIYIAIQKGDPSRLNFLLERTIGKVIEIKEVAVKDITYKTSILKDSTIIQEALIDD